MYHLTNINTHDKYVRISKLKIIFEEKFIFFGIVGDSIFCFLLNIFFIPSIKYFGTIVIDTNKKIKKYLTIIIIIIGK